MLNFLEKSKIPIDNMAGFDYTVVHSVAIRFFAVLFCGERIVWLFQRNLTNKEHNNEKLCKKSPDFIGKTPIKFGEISNVKMDNPGKAGGGGHSVVRSGRILNDIRQTF
ncbi:MAG: hypothetical protein LBC20_04435 [Planctomycetaceae bacterium]|nr:hypothetical protein [Planctomycetaceae bacterium]